MTAQTQPPPEPIQTNWLSRILTAFGYVLAVPLFPLAVKIVQEYERGVIFRLGRLVGARGPGLFLIIPIVERMVKVDLRIVTMDVPRQDVITADNVTVKVDAVVYFRVTNPEDAVVRVMDYVRATSLVAQTTLRSVLGQSHLDELLSKREEVNQRLQQIIDDATEPWGIKVTIVEVRDVGLPPEMIRAIARQAEAERERRAKVIHAQGEYEAAEKLSDAGKVMAATPTTLQLRYLQTLTEIASEHHSTVIFPVPIDTIAQLMRALAGAAAGDGGGGREQVPVEGEAKAKEDGGG
jgi:regulator of protease activity HflC (stomatin/prohibitin superfamily)